MKNTKCQITVCMFAKNDFLFERTNNYRDLVYNTYSIPREGDFIFFEFPACLRLYVWEFART